MPSFSPTELKRLTEEIFSAAGARAEHAEIVADSLVQANLAGHDSHGVLRIPEYVRWMEQKLVNVDAKLQMVLETDAFALVDGEWGFGQVMGRKVVEIGVAKAARSGAAVLSGRNCCHLGRIGEYPEMIAERGMAAVMFVNTHGGGKLVAPFGGIERRLSANPISIGIPRSSSGGPIVVDISTCSIAEGKVRTMLNGGRPVPPGCVIDANGNPSTDPAALYGPPPGALLPFGGHKGFALSLATDILAGAISGAGCSRPDADRVGNSFLLTIIDVDRVRGAAFDEDVRGLLDYVKSSKLAPGVSEILAPGEPERRERERREKQGISIDDNTWRQIAETAKRYSVETGTPA